MIIQASVTNEYRSLLDPIYEDADAGLRAVLAETAGSPLGVRQSALHDVLPLLGGSSSDAVSSLSAVFFDSLMEIQGVRRSVASDLLEPVDSKVWHALVGWAFSDGGTGRSVLERGGEALLYSLLSGGLTRSLARVGADTMVGNAALQPELMKAQRVPSAGCCNFCAMLASRFGEYSAESAGKVVGRGMPVEATIKGYRADGTPIRKQGGQALGVKPRGTRQLGEDFHDNCRCSVVIITEGNYAQLQADADKYYDAYREAADKVNDGLILRATDVSTETRLKNKYEWVKGDGTVTTPKSRTNEIVRAMNALNPVDKESPVI